MPLSLRLALTSVRKLFGEVSVAPAQPITDDLLLTQAGDVIITQDERALIKQEASFNLITQSGVFFTTQDDRIFETS